MCSTAAGARARARGPSRRPPRPARSRRRAHRDRRARARSRRRGGRPDTRRSYARRCRARTRGRLTTASQERHSDGVFHQCHEHGHRRSRHRSGRPVPGEATCARQPSICHRDALLRSALPFRTRIAMTDDARTDGPTDRVAAAVPPPDSRRGARRRIDVEALRQRVELEHRMPRRLGPPLLVRRLGARRRRTGASPGRARSSAAAPGPPGRDRSPRRGSAACRARGAARPWSQHAHS